MRTVNTKALAQCSMFNIKTKYWNLNLGHLNENPTVSDP